MCVSRCWSGTFDADDFGSGCVQAGDAPGSVYGSEDCLVRMYACMWWRCQLTASLCLPPCRVQFVNVWTRAAAKKLPVMVFIYGGSLITGDSKWYVPREILTVASLFALPWYQPTVQVSAGRACSERRGCGCQHQLPPERLWFYGIAGPWDCRPSRCQRKLRLPRPAARLAMGARQHRCVWR